MLICAGAMEALARDLNLLPMVGMLNVSNIAMDHWAENDPVTHKWMYVWYETDGRQTLWVVRVRRGGYRIWNLAMLRILLLCL